MKFTNNILYLFFINTIIISNIHCHTITAQISFGELIDKITILTIKSERITNQAKLKNIYIELAALQKTYNTHIKKCIHILQLQEQLKTINEALWEIEDAIRIKERKQEFDAEFIELARNVYITNDKRCMIKKQIDELLGSTITEEKSYEDLV